MTDSVSSLFDKTEGVDSSPDSEMELFEPFIHDGFVSLSSDFSDSTPIRILRDTGSAQTLMLSNTLPFSNRSFTGAHALVNGVFSDQHTSVPLHRVHLKLDLISGNITVGIRTTLPFKGIQLLLGNDVAGDKVQPVPIVTEKPSLDQDIDPENQEIPGLYLHVL